MPDSAIHPRLRDPVIVADLRARFAASGGCLRIDEVLMPGIAAALPEPLLALPFELHHVQDEHARCLFWRCVVQNHDDLPWPWDWLGRFLRTDLPALVSAITGREAAGLTEDWIPVCLFTKGSYLDAHEDHGAGRATAFVLGLTQERWPEGDGGCLELLADDRETVVERRAPGFDTLDLYDVRPVVRWHRVPLLVEHHRRLTVSGWVRS